MARTAWTLTDNSTGTPVVFSFDKNPNEFKRPGREASIKEDTVTAPNGTRIFFQGRDKARKGSMKGAVFTQTEFNNIETWGNKWVPLTLTDDLGGSWDIVIQKLTWTRIRRANNPYRHDYEIEFYVL